MIIATARREGRHWKDHARDQPRRHEGRRGTPRVLLVDADRRGSSRFWARTRSSLRQPRLDSPPLYGEAFARRIATIASGYDDVVIDIGAGDGSEMDTALRAADCVLAPLQPTGVDVWTAGLVDGRVAEALARNPDLQAWALFNRVPTNPRNTGTRLRPG